MTQAIPDFGAVLERLRTAKAVRGEVLLTDEEIGYANRARSLEDLLGPVPPPPSDLGL